MSGLRRLSVSELTETLEEVETAIRRYSEELIQALALRDELDYEKEVLNPNRLSSFFFLLPTFFFFMQLAASSILKTSF